ncbi:unnamed protein product [Pleuronectes platessa]|uniref:Uncharacterized protein n=1 Tax=Pleuronectes platessa TaxID=8262 RepID=A0A9N7Y8E9_PLEPL|nr:unnamed protein product [Pleuronectes platessa]
MSSSGCIIRAPTSERSRRLEHGTISSPGLLQRREETAEQQRSSEPHLSGPVSGPTTHRGTPGATQRDVTCGMRQKKETRDPKCFWRTEGREERNPEEKERW